MRRESCLFLILLSGAGLLSGISARSEVLPVSIRSLMRIDPFNRKAVNDAYLEWAHAPLPTETYLRTADCVAPQTSVEFQLRVIDQVNFYRAMVGLNPVQVETKNEIYRQAALMMAVNRELNHNPPVYWKCYSEKGAKGAASANLSAIDGIAAIDNYIDDYGEGNESIGHRRWILMQAQRAMATGDYGGNALGVFIDRSGKSDQVPFVAWPSAGYFPIPLLPSSNRWSFSIPKADFSGAQVSIVRINKNRGPENLSVAPYVATQGYGDNTLVWEMDEENGLGYEEIIPEDIEFKVKVTGVRVGGSVRDYEYSVKAFEPGK